jgi:hypothetical protein
MKRIYKYYPEDFGELTVKVVHMISFSICSMIIQSDISSQIKNSWQSHQWSWAYSKNLEILSVIAVDYDIDHEYGKKTVSVWSDSADSTSEHWDHYQLPRPFADLLKHTWRSLLWRRLLQGAPPHADHPMSAMGIPRNRAVYRWYDSQMPLTLQLSLPMSDIPTS